ncbi:response regulator [Nucisporomicrobium flavum]|uniref:response regulator n=1 Tax=Nucisporomicrobium flavum TaxID=2785915 RepID=UPI0018F6F1A4|nr:response regulator transcription factor [Nucisporomicrobium flavum]
MSDAIRVLLVDDEELVRTGLRMILESQPDIEVVGEAADGTGVAGLARRTRADVVLMDIRMPRVDGIRATAEVVAGSPATRVIMLTTFDLDEHVLDSLRAGASGFLVKDTPRAALVDAVRVVAAGEALLTPRATRRLLAEFVRLDPRPGRPAGDVLTPREVEVLAALAGGRSNAEIAADLVLSEHTVKTHVGSILTKLGLRDRVQAVIYAFEEGIVPLRRRS